VDLEPAGRSCVIGQPILRQPIYDDARLITLVSTHTDAREPFRQRLARPSRVSCSSCSWLSLLRRELPQSRLLRGVDGGTPPPVRNPDRSFDVLAYVGVAFRCRRAPRRVQYRRRRKFPARWTEQTDNVTHILDTRRRLDIPWATSSRSPSWGRCAG
jgi:hypothetical protein